MYYHIITFGCQMNEHDSEKIAGLLSGEGYRATDDLPQADIIILNTCSVRDKAEQKVFSLLGRMKPLKEQNPALILAVCGCVAQGMKGKIRQRAPYVDLVFGTQNIENLPLLLQEVRAKHRPRIEIIEGRISPTDRHNLVRQSNFKAWVTIMEGCNNFCTYCVVPYVRGRERSRSNREIATEVRELADQGIQEITLLGQNVNSYGSDLAGEVSFSGLLALLNNIPGIERIRFVTSHPKDFNSGLIYALRDLDKVCEQIHLPFQAGSNNILSAMNRRYTREEYLEKVQLLRETVPGVEISTDVIVAFPGETEEDFTQTLDVLKQVCFESIFSFIYSDRPLSQSKIKAPRLPYQTSLARFERLWQLQNQITSEINQTLIGKKMEVLVEEFSKTDPGLLTGRTRTNRLVHFAGDKSLIGRFADVEITEGGKHSLRGQLVF
ncbi:MAG: tRNA (N6-isopentenyl adenosine(37)-C2)-methylthiotransferase MiaB [Candidatus Schekmanbacteria bacterium]|nr:tRNA (N6-isopentenyl adenosine(37)-C2)-methylthiotransferase MiaB [Candidatus Schekmanbacteria bacterium]